MSLSVLTSLDIDYVCSSLQDVYICINSHLDGCDPGFKLAYYTAITAARYICNEGRQGYISNARCLLGRSVLPALQSCTTSLINNFPSSSKNLNDDKEKICRLFSDWDNCMVRPVLDTCNSTAVTYMKTLLYTTIYTSWHKNWVPCTIEITSKPPLTTTESSTTNVSTHGPRECDVQGATQCLSTIPFESSYQPTVIMFATNLINITAENLQSICMYLQDAYHCVGTKLDKCSDGVHLLRDVILLGSRYICNEHRGAFLDSIGCLSKLLAARTTINCFNGGPHPFFDIDKYLTGQKSVFSNKEEFCRISSNWTTCYMESVSSLCSKQEYDFVFQFMTHAYYNPLKTAIQCDIFSEIAQPESTPTVIPEPTIEPLPTAEITEPEPTPDVTPEPTNEPEPTPDATPEPTNEPIPTAEITEPEPTPAVTHEQTSKTTKTTPVITSNSPRRECTCYNGGTCIQHSNGFTCICPPKMFGMRCELGVGGCPGYPCFNGGSCQTNDNGPRCLCPAGFPGLHCEAVSACASYVCWNGGTCHTRTISNVEEAFCSCQHGFIGKLCETNLLWVTVRPTNGTDSDSNSTVMETPETTDVESTTPITSPTTDNPVSTSSANPFTPTVSLQPKNCRYVGFQTSPGRRRRFNRWCRWNCNRGYCPSSLCRCDSEATDSIMCYSIGIYRRMVGMSGWCNNNCKRQYCPRNMCKCKRV